MGSAGVQQLILASPFPLIVLIPTITAVSVFATPDSPGAPSARTASEFPIAAFKAMVAECV